MKNQTTFNMTMTAMFIAMIAVMTFVPNVGYINLIVIKATILHVPVIIGSIVLGPKSGAVLGTVFGMTSLLKNTLEPSLLSFAFSPFYSVGDIGGNGWSIVIALVPRILVGIVPYFVFKGIEQLIKNKKGRRMLALPLACLAGSLTNTLLVMNLIYLCFREEFATVKEIAIESVYNVILGIIAANGIPEAVAAMITGTAISLVLLKVMSQESKYPREVQYLNENLIRQNCDKEV